MSGHPTILASKSQISNTTNSTKSIAPDNWCCTDVDKHHATFLWTLNNFPDYIYKNGERVQSTKFLSKDNKLEWRIDLYPKGVRVNYDGFVSLFLHSSRRSTGGSTLTADVSFRLLNSDETEIKNVKYKHCIFEAGKSVGCPIVMSYSTLLQKLSEDGTLVIYCEVTAIRQSGARTIAHGTLQNSNQQSLAKNSLKSDLCSFLDGGELVDVQLNVGSETFYAHKAILAARSAVFRGMFSHDFVESRESKVTITEMDPIVFKTVLRYIYSDSVEEVAEMAEELLVAADRYDLTGLKEACEHKLKTDITQDNVCDVLIVAARNNAELLKTECISRIKMSAERVFSSDSWRNLITKDPTLASDVLVLCSKKDF